MKYTLIIKNIVESMENFFLRDKGAKSVFYHLSMSFVYVIEKG